MLGIEKSLDILDKFIRISIEIAKLPTFVVCRYQAPSQNIDQIHQKPVRLIVVARFIKLVTPNINLSRWLYRFIYFDFRLQDALRKFMKVLQEYTTMKNRSEFQQLKSSCSDIGSVYYQHILSKLVD